MPRTVLETRNLVKRYGGFTAVDDLSFDVYEGDIFTLLAPRLWQRRSWPPLRLPYWPA